jgi:hypothetical protein
MPISQNIPRKQGTIGQPSYSPAINPSIFGPRGNAGANVGDAANPVLRASNYVLSAVPYNTTSNTGGAKNPVGNHSNTATQLDVPALVSNSLTNLVPVSQAVDVAPHERGSFFSPVTPSSKEEPQRASGGVDPNSNTPFHPKQIKSTRQKRYPTQAGERTASPSFGSSNTLAGGTGHSGATAVANGGGTAIGTSRWGTVKRGAAESPVLHHGTLAGPSTRGVTVGSGTTGTTSTAGKGKRSTVNQNVHSGSPFVIPWVPNPRGSQPNEQGTTFPMRLGCSNGCK